MSAASLATPAMGLGDMLAAQAGDETEEQRKRRLALQAQNNPLSSALGLQTRPGAMSSVFGGAY